jgi:hypothetical protein
MLYHSHASYTVGTVTGTANCITAWDKMTGNCAHLPSGLSTAQSNLEVAASSDCRARINGLDNLALGGVVLAAVALTGALSALVMPPN